MRFPLLHWKKACQLLHGNPEGSPRTWPLAGVESWLQFELMLLRRSQWVPSGPFRRLQIAFKPIHPGEGEGGEGTESALGAQEARKVGKGWSQHQGWGQMVLEQTCASEPWFCELSLTSQVGSSIMPV